MAIDTFVVFTGIYSDVESAEADYQTIKDLHTEHGLLDAYDAAVIARNDKGKVKITKKHETPTRAGGVMGGGVGLATGLVVALFPFAGIGAAALTGLTGGAVIGAVAGHAAAGMSRSDLKDLGEELDAGTAAVIVVGVQDSASRIEEALKKAQNVQRKEMKVDTAELEADAGDDTEADTSSDSDS